MLTQLAPGGSGLEGLWPSCTRFPFPDGAERLQPLLSFFFFVGSETEPERFRVWKSHDRCCFHGCKFGVKARGLAGRDVL